MVHVFAGFVRPLIIASAILSGTTPVQADPLQSGWALDAGASTVTFGSQHSSDIVETHAFEAYRGVIDQSGAAVLKIRLASLNTQNDMRDVRLRYLFFETFKFPEATVNTQIAREDFYELDEVRQLNLTLPFTLDLHGVVQELSADVIASLGTDKSVSVTTAQPVVIRAEDFGLLPGLSRLEDAFYGEIQPEFPVTFELIFRPYQADLPSLVSTSKQLREACEARLAKAATPGEVQFQKGSSQVAESSRPALERIVGIAKECEGLTITVEGHTDSVGAESANQTLSEKRANSVAKYLVKIGLPESRISARGRGETEPIAANDTASNRAKNRRIEFHIDPES